jgi:hypothetical protein
MPADDGIGANDHEVVLPTRPESGERDPERTIQRAQSRSKPTLRVHRKLLTQGKLDDCLILAAPEEGDDAVKKQRYEMDQSAHGERDPAQYFSLERV